jgi:hypothetical protein
MFTDGTQGNELPMNDKVPLGRVTPALSPDGKTLAFSAKVDNDFKLFIWALGDNNAVVGEPTQITKDADCSDKFPSWSPDGSQIAYLSTDKDKQISLRVINADGSGMRTLHDKLHCQSTPSWRPDGQALLCIDKAELGNKLVIKTMLVTGGWGLEIPLDSDIIAACFSPDGDNVAALARGKKFNELWIIRQPGTSKKQILSSIVDGKSICWPAPDTILFSATRVANSGKLFYSVSPSRKNLSGIPGIADPKQVAWISAQMSKEVAPMPTVVNPDAGPGPDATTEAPKERVPNGPVTIVRPFEGTPVHGIVPVKIIAQKEVSSIIVSIGPQFVYAAAPRQNDKGPNVLQYSWNTQQFADFDPSGDREFPTSYQQLLSYPDGDYTLTVTALNEKRQLVGKDTLQVKVQNSVDESTLPASLMLKFQYKSDKDAEGIEELYTVHGEGAVFGVNPGEVSSLAATLDARIRRSLIEVQPSGAAILRTYVLEPSGHYPMSFGLKEATIPESELSAKYKLEPNGNMSMLQQRLSDLYLPLTQVALPLPSTQATLNTQWDGNVWVVSDLMEREATLVSSSNSIDGLEWIENRPTVRIKCDLQFSDLSAKLPDGIYLAINPTTSAPGLRGAKAALMAAANTGTTNPFGGTVPGATPDRGINPGAPGQSENAPQIIKVSNTVGYRYAWFDYQHMQLVRVEDFFLYTFPLSNLPLTGTPGAQNAPGAAANPGTMPPPGTIMPTIPTDNTTPGTTTTPSERAGNGWYVVHYTYTFNSENEK